MTEIFCVEEITDAISAIGGITAVVALVGAFSSFFALYNPRALVVFE